MALQKVKLPKVNQSRQRTRLRPREIAGPAASKVAFTAGRQLIWGGVGTISSGAAFTASNNRHVLQKDLSAGLINIAP